MLERVSSSVGSQVWPSPPFALALTAIFAGFTFGGGTFQWLPSEFVCQAFGVVVLAVGLFQVMHCAGIARLRFELGLAAAILFLPAMQIIPLPPWLWTRLPGRQFLVDEFHAIGNASLPWQPISLSPDATWQALLSLGLPLGVFLTGLLLTFRERRLLSLAVMAFVSGSIVLALLQQIGGMDSPLRFYALTNESLPVGWFANRNHFAAFLYCTLPISFAWMIALGLERAPTRRSPHARHKRALFFLTAAAVFVALLLMQGLVHSRAGLFITVLALCSSVTLAIPFQRSELGKRAIKILLGPLAVAVILIGYSALAGILEQFDRDPVEDMRFVIVKGSLQAMYAFFPVGAGFGTFDVVYQRFEQPVNATSEYVNRAHNDIIETVMEGGISTVAILLFFSLWMLRRIWGVWASSTFREASVIDAALARGAAFVPLLLAAHSVLDYPLRTEAVMSYLAVCCALVVPPVTEDIDGRRTAKRRRHRTHSSSSEWIASRSRQIA